MHSIDKLPSTNSFQALMKYLNFDASCIVPYPLLQLVVNLDLVSIYLFSQSLSQHIYTNFTQTSYTNEF